MFRLTEGGATVMDSVERGTPDDTAAVRGLLDRFVDAGALHPLPESGPFTIDDVTFVVQPSNYGPTRATNVVLTDHIPDGTTLIDGSPFHGGEVWNGDLGLQFALSETGNTEVFMRSEIDRYLGWPGQAISYKVGERIWLEGRDAARRTAGPRFDLRAFHSYALDLGGMGLGLLREELGRMPTGP